MNLEVQLTFSSQSRSPTLAMRDCQ